MPSKMRLWMSAAAFGAMALASPSQADGVRIGILTCHVDSGWGFIFGSSKQMQCTFRSDRGEAEYYSGTIDKLGVDIGYTGDGEIVWDVIAPATGARMGALQGDYGGAAASVTLLAGVGAHVLIGGFENSIALQPVSVEGNSGLDIAAGAGAMSLRADTTSRTALRFEVYFDPDSIYLSPEGGDQVEHAVNAAEETGLMRVRVIGDAGTVEPDPYDTRVSDRRALSVRNELLRDGLTGASISIDGRASGDPRALTDPEMRARESGRVTIELTSLSPSDTRYR